VTGLVLIPPTHAEAHVTVQVDSITSDSYAELTFRVPNEMPTAMTTKVVVTLPTKDPSLSLWVRPVPG
jgi:uncharacterized protein YcnI